MFDIESSDDSDCCSVDSLPISQNKNKILTDNNQKCSLKLAFCKPREKTFQTTTDDQRLILPGQSGDDSLFVVDKTGDDNVAFKSVTTAIKNPKNRNSEKAGQFDNFVPEKFRLKSKLSEHDLYVRTSDSQGFSETGLYERRRHIRQKVDKKKIEEIMKKSVINDDFMKQEKVLPYYESVQAKRKRRKAEREKTKGKGWFDMPATEMTDERKRDLEIMMMRNSLDTKNYYRRDDRKVLPKYFQVGTVIEHATDFYTGRIPKKQRKRTIVEELLADAQFRKYPGRKNSKSLK